MDKTPYHVINGRMYVQNHERGRTSLSDSIQWIHDGITLCGDLRMETVQSASHTGSLTHYPLLLLPSLPPSIHPSIFPSFLDIQVGIHVKGLQPRIHSLTLESVTHLSTMTTSHNILRILQPATCRYTSAPQFSACRFKRSLSNFRAVTCLVVRLP